MSGSPRRGDPARLADILAAIERIEAFAPERGKVVYYSAIERELEIIGEAAHTLSPEFKASVPDIPWSQIRALRNRLAHSYWAIDKRVLDEVVDAHLPPLKQAVGRGLARYGTDEEESLPTGIPPNFEPMDIVTVGASGSPTPADEACGKRMPIARSWCALPPGHKGHCRRAQ